MSQGFPRKFVLWSGAILGGIVNAVMTARRSSFAYAQDWSGTEYGLNGADGREGLISFEKGSWSWEGQVVGAFYDVHSKRRDYDLEYFFKGCPSFQRSRAEEKILPVLRLEVRGKVRPRVTAAFWNEGEHLTAVDPWEVVLANGVDLIESELIEDQGAALRAWEDDYGMSAEQVNFARTLYEQKIARPDKVIELSGAEAKWLESTFEDPRQIYLAIAQLKSKLPEEERGCSDLRWLDSIDPKAEFQKVMSICREKFAAIGILFPKAK